MEELVAERSPLAGLRVIDAASMVMVPAAAVILADFGQKSPLGATSASANLADGQPGPVVFEVLSLVRSWQTTPSIPTALSLSLAPEASNFIRAAFSSTRTAGREPRLLLTYAPSFPFERP